jgi:hypothetical protein
MIFSATSTNNWQEGGYGLGALCGGRLDPERGMEASGDAREPFLSAREPDHGGACDRGAGGGDGRGGDEHGAVVAAEAELRGPGEREP